MVQMPTIDFHLRVKDAQPLSGMHLDYVRFIAVSPLHFNDKLRQTFLTATALMRNKRKTFFVQNAFNFIM